MPRMPNQMAPKWHFQKSLQCSAQWQVSVRTSNFSPVSLSPPHPSLVSVSVFKQTRKRLTEVHPSVIAGALAQEPSLPLRFRQSEGEDGECESE